MVILLYTVDLFPGREFLMPWRTIVEVAQYLLKQGNEVSIVNGCHDKRKDNGVNWYGVPVINIESGWDNLAHYANKKHAEFLFVPVTWRDGLKSFLPFKDLKCRKISYLSGGVYNLSNVLSLARYGTFKEALPYLLECVVPKKLLAYKLKKSGFDTTIGLTEYTFRVAGNHGMPNPRCVYPGNDTFNELVPDNSIIERYNLVGKKWMLFTGSTAPIRGASLVVKAVDMLKSNILVVMLIRADIGTNIDAINEQIGNMRHPERIILITDKLSRKQLRGFFGAAWYGILPFLCIPSEVPLTYFELLSCGTPVVSFQNGGTTDYLKEALYLSRNGVKNLSKALENCWHNNDERTKRSIVGVNIMGNHLTWEKISTMWEQISVK